jgi:hypothetical protein
MLYLQKIEEASQTIHHDWNERYKAGRLTSLVEVVQQASKIEKKTKMTHSDSDGTSAKKYFVLLLILPSTSIIMFGQNNNECGHAQEP